MDRGFRAGIAHLDPYRIDAWVFAAGEDCQACRLHHCFINAATSHEFSYDFVLWYMPLKYTMYHANEKLKIRWVFMRDILVLPRVMSPVARFHPPKRYVLES